MRIIKVFLSILILSTFTPELYATSEEANLNNDVSLPSASEGITREENPTDFRLEDWTYTFSDDAGQPIALLTSYLPNTDTIYIPGAYIFPGETEPRRIVLNDWKVFKSVEIITKSKKIIIEENFDEKVLIKSPIWNEDNSIFSGFAHSQKVAYLEYADLRGLETSHVTSLEQFFREARKLQYLLVDGWDTSNVTNMLGTFTLMDELLELDITSWDTSKVQGAAWGFNGLPKLKRLDLSNYDTSNFHPTSNHSGGYRPNSWMFGHNPNLKVIDITNIKGPNLLYYETFYEKDFSQKLIISPDPNYLNLSYGDNAQKIIPLEVFNVNAKGGTFADGTTTKKIKYDKVAYDTPENAIDIFNNQVDELLNNPPQLPGKVFTGWNQEIKKISSLKELEDYVYDWDKDLEATWEQSQDIKWDFLDAEISNITETLAVGGILTPPTASKEGKYIEGWYADMTFTQPVPANVPEDPSGQLITYYANWETKKYDVLFETNVENLNIPKQSIPHGGKVTAPEEIQKDNHIFKGWYDNPTFIGNKWDFEMNVVTSEKTFYAKWEPVPQYKVTYDSNGGNNNVPQETTDNKAGDLITVLFDKTPVLAGSTFVGWEYNGHLYEESNAPETFVMPASNVTLVAKWKIDPVPEYKVTYDSNGGNNNVPQETTDNKAGDVVTVLFDKTPVLAGSTFVGWEYNGHLYEESNAPETFVMPASNVTLVAKWKIDPVPEYKVTYDSNGGNNNVPQETTDNKAGDVVTVLFDKTPVLAGSTFVGWEYSGHLYEESNAPETFVMPASNVTLVAKWKIDPVPEYKVTYDSNGGDNNVPQETTDNKAGDVVTVLFDKIPVLAGSTFIGWEYNGHLYEESNAPETFVMPASNVTLVAKWKIDPVPEYKVTYDSNGGNNNVPQETTDNKAGDVVTVLFDKIPVLAGSTFIGWEYNGHLYEESNAPETFVMPASNVTLVAKWKIDPVPEYKVTYDSNGGNNNVPQETTDNKAGDVVTVSFDKTPVLAGSTFIGWEYNGHLYEESNAPETFVMPASDVTLVAKWKIDPVPQYKVTYDSNGGNNNVPQETTDNKAGDVVTVSFDKTPVLAGSTFVGWEYNGHLYEESNAPETFVMPASNVTLVAKWKIDPVPEYKVTYDSNGGNNNVPQETTDNKAGDLITVLFDKTPVLAGSTFIGWEYNGHLYEESNAPETFVMPASNVTLVAKWKIDPVPEYKVTYDSNGGNNNIPQETTDNKAGDLITVLFDKTPVLAGSTFIGWEYNGHLYEESNAPETFVMPASNVTLVAKWKIDPVPEYKVTYDSNGGNNNIPQETTDNKAGDLITVLFDKTPVLAGSTFVGWEYNGHLYEESNAPETFVMPASNVTLVAKWKIDPVPEYKVTYDSNGGNNNVPQETTDNKAGDVVTVLFDKIPVLAGSTFIGWEYNGHLYEESNAPETFVMPASNVTLVAKWKTDPVPQYKVTYDSNGGEGTLPVDKNIYAENANVVLLSPDALSKKNHHFSGWTIAKDGSGKVYQPGETFTMKNEDVTLFAQWKQNKVIYDGNGSDSGEVPQDDFDYSVGDDVVVQLGSISREGHTFIGWEYRGDIYQPGDIVVITDDDIIFVAQWEINIYSVIFETNGGNPTIENQKIEYGQKIVMPDTITKNGYQFFGWYTTPTFSGYFWDFETDIVRGDMKLYAKWEKVTPIKPINPNEKLPTTGQNIFERQVLGMLLVLLGINLIAINKFRKK